MEMEYKLKNYFQDLLEQVEEVEAGVKKVEEDEIWLKKRNNNKSKIIIKIHRMRRMKKIKKNVLHKIIIKITIMVVITIIICKLQLMTY